MKQTVANKLGKLLVDPRFRGLWRSREVSEDGKRTTAQWSVTFVLDGDCCEIAYRPTMQAAVRTALNVLEEAD